MVDAIRPFAAPLGVSWPNAAAAPAPLPVLPVAPIGLVPGASLVKQAGKASTTPYQDAHKKLEAAKQQRLLLGVGEWSADWMRLNLVASAVLGLADDGSTLARDALHTAARARLAATGLDGDVDALTQRLIAAGIIKVDGAGVALAQPPEEVAMRMHDVDYIGRRLEAGLRAVQQDPANAAALLGTVKKLAMASERFPIYPVESRWPFLKAVSLLSPADEKALAALLSSDAELRHMPLVDSALLMLTGQPPADWVARYAPNLAGSAVYTVAAEAWYVAGGLGRVQQYHAAAMKKLVGDAARVVTIEPFYTQRPNGTPIDYATLPTPVEGLRLAMRFEVLVGGKPWPVEVHKGTNKLGIEVYLVRDPRNVFTKQIYTYSQDGNGSLEDFSEYLSRASVELIARLELGEKAKKGAAYKPPAIIANDGQTSPIVPFFRQREQKDDALAGTALWMVTHTYKNRGIFAGDSGRALLDKWHTPNEQRAAFWRLSEADITSPGVRLADGASGVSAIHRDEVAHIDPSALLLAITNGDNRAASSRIFRDLLERRFPGADPEHPTAAQVRTVKRDAKERIGLDPDRPVISYSGRMVREKGGRERAFTDENLRALVGKGAQVVIYGNVQSFGESRAMFDALAALSTELNARGPGKLVVRTGWGLDEQISLLAASDVQVQDSDRGTGAAEYSEADVTANAGLQLGPPWIEGIIQRQGVILDRTRPGSGNTLLPRDGSPKAYLDALSWVVDTFDKQRDVLAQYQAHSIAVSRILEAVVPGAEYLRQLDRIMGEKRERGE